MIPAFTPLEANDMTEGTYGDWRITFEGPQGCPDHMFFPIVEHIPTNKLYVPSGEETTADSVWYTDPSTMTFAPRK
jgi:hypothetical protein